ncbi:MAG TPA: hypothetical protein VGI78_19420, partial [Acetobacteraceae bacterium]
GKSPRAAARFAARLAGEATVAHSIAFARATEAVSGGELPPRATALRDAMAEIERIACHLDVLSAMAEITGVEAMVTRAAWHAEAIRRASYTAFGHRLMMDCVIPGGVGADVVPGGGEAIGRALSALAVERLDWPVTGVAEAQARDRLAEIQGSIRAARDLLGELPGGAVSVSLPAASGEAIGFAEGPSGAIWHWLRLDHGQIASVFMCDPAWAHWPELEAAMAGRQMDDLPLMLAAFGLTSSGMDL